jgi:hypothetical protein
MARITPPMKRGKQYREKRAKANQAKARRAWSHRDKHDSMRQTLRDDVHGGAEGWALQQHKRQHRLKHDRKKWRPTEGETYSFLPLKGKGLMRGKLLSHRPTRRNKQLDVATRRTMEPATCVFDVDGKQIAVPLSFVKSPIGAKRAKRRR